MGPLPVSASASLAGGQVGDPGSVRVLVVDDSPDIRMMLGLILGRDARFRLVGEAGDGQEAVRMAGRLRPDLVIIDRQMPVMGGIEAIPLIREASPGSEIVLYTAAAEEDTERLAISAGAIGLLEKRAIAVGVAESLAEILVRRWGDPAADVEVRIGPVSSAAARSWVANTRQILAAVVANPRALDRPLDESAAGHFSRFLDLWEEIARTTDVFLWVGRAVPADVRLLVEEWARVDSLPEERLAELGCHWSGPTGRPFFEALIAGVMDALRKHEETARLAERLSSGVWPAASR